MSLRQHFEHGVGKAHRLMAKRFARRLASIDLVSPVVSFTFDDAPKTAFCTGRDILSQSGARATYYVSLGLLDSETEVGRIASREDLLSALADGCELGCHTLDHLDAQRTPLNEFVESVTRNGMLLREIAPETDFRTFAYPKNGPSLAAKTAIAKRFRACRGGGQTTNETVTDLNLLKAVFLDRRTGVDEKFVRELIDYNAERRGWLIFATHDITDSPSPYGCTPKLLQSAATASLSSGSTILPVAEACALLSQP